MDRLALFKIKGMLSRLFSNNVGNIGEGIYSVLELLWWGSTVCLLKGKEIKLKSITVPRTTNTLILTSNSQRSHHRVCPLSQFDAEIPLSPRYQLLYFSRVLSPPSLE